jgi:hypothetical protein
MKLGPFEIRWPVRAAAAPEPVREPKKAQGATGTTNMRGWLVQEEYLDDLKGQTGIATYDRMARSDAAVQEALGHIVYPILNGNFEVDPASDSPEDHEIAEFIRCALFDWLDRPFHDHLREALSFLQFGHSVFETPLKVISASLEYDDPSSDDGTQLTTPERQWLVWDDFQIRLPRTLHRWHTEGGKLRSLTQLVWKDDGYAHVEIPAEDLIVFTHQRVGDDYTGTSLLRGAYQAWFMKQAVQNVLGLAIQAHGIGINTLYMPNWARENPELEEKCEQILADLRAGDSVYALWPGPKATGNTDGFHFEITTPQSGGENIGGITNALEYFRGEIKGAVLARFSELGHGSTGARATGDTQSEIWYDALRSVARQLGEGYQPAIRRLVDANYAGVREYPKLVCRDIESRDLALYGQTIAQLTAAGAWVADKPARAWLRTLFDAPDEDETDPAHQQPDPNADPNLDGPQHDPPATP